SFVSAVNSVDFPERGSPTRPTSFIGRRDYQRRGTLLAMEGDRDRGPRMRRSNLYIAVVAAEMTFLVWLGWHRGQLLAFAFLALMGAVALVGANYAAASSARIARWMRARGADEN